MRGELGRLLPPRDATDNANRSAKELTSLARNGVAGTGRELWATVAPDTADNLYGRWNAEVKGATAADDYRNVANTYGWNVEIDPFTPTSTPKKRTAMGRFAHEGAWLAKAVAGKPVVFYMGDDSRGEYVYKYVSTAVWDTADATRGLAAGDKYLDSGKLYVAEVQCRRHRQLAGSFARRTPRSPTMRPMRSLMQADVLINCATGRGCGRCDQDGPPGVGCGRSRDRRGLHDADQ